MHKKDENEREGKDDSVVLGLSLMHKKLNYLKKILFFIKYSKPFFS